MNPYHKHQELGVDYLVAKSISSKSIAKVSRLVAQTAQQIILLLHGTEKWTELSWLADFQHICKDSPY